MLTLLIWDSCGLNPIELYACEGETAKLAVASHGQYVNSSELPEDASVYTLSEMIYARKLRELQPSEALGPFEAVVIAGFMP